MFDIGWSEMGLILAVALVVVGPKDLPRLARTLGQWAAKGRAMAREFQRHIDDMAREADLEDLKDSVQKISPHGIRKTITDTLDPDGSMKRAMDTTDIKKAFDTSDLDRAMNQPATPAPAAAAAAEPVVAAPSVPETPAVTAAPEPVTVAQTSTPPAPAPTPVEPAVPAPAATVSGEKT